MNIHLWLSKKSGGLFPDSKAGKWLDFMLYPGNRYNVVVLFSSQERPSTPCTDLSTQTGLSIRIYRLVLQVEGQGIQQP
jgi:hypothetical protein